MAINRPIRTDEEHAESLCEIDGLMNAEAGTPEGDRLDLLVTLGRTVIRWAQLPQPVIPGLDPGIHVAGTKI